jgi:hypothetical protein
MSMRASPSNPSGTFLPPKLWIFIGLGTTPLFYFILRLDYRGPSLTPGEIVFLWAYALFCTFNWIFARSQRLWIDSHLPPWLNLRWVRFLLCFILAFALIGLLSLLRIPTFYAGIIGKSVTFVLLPYVVNFRRTAWTFGPPRVLPPSSLSGTNEELTLRMKPSKAIFLLVASAAFVAGGIFMLRQNAGLAWIAICFFGLGIPIGIVMLLTGGYTLILKRDEFTMTTLWRRFSFRWTEVNDFTLVDTPQGSRVGFNVREDLSERPAAWKKRIAAGKWMVEIYGRNAILPDDYGVSADELCRIMTARKSEAEQGG